MFNTLQRTVKLLTLLVCSVVFVLAFSVPSVYAEHWCYTIIQGQEEYTTFCSENTDDNEAACNEDRSQSPCLENPSCTVTECTEGPHVPPTPDPDEEDDDDEGGTTGGDDEGGTTGGLYVLENPIEADDLGEFLEQALVAITTFLIPIIIIFIILVGFQFVIAQGNEEKLKKAKQNLLYVLIGAAIIIGSRAIYEILKATIDALG